MSEPLEANLKDRRGTRTLGAPPVLPELRGKRAAWTGVESAEPMLRGCDQRELLERLAADGIRHLVVPLNGLSEDSCIFARKHAESGGALYDLERRDEGAFTRLKFLLEAAGSAGVLVGLSLFDATPGSEAGPLARGGNLQGLCLSDNTSGRSADRLWTILKNAADWICSAVRGFHGVWIEPLRHARGEPTAHESDLCARLAAALARHREDLSPMRLGPWVAPRRAGTLAEKFPSQTAPFDASVMLAANGPGEFSEALRQAETHGPSRAAATFFDRSPARRPALLRFATGALDTARGGWLWRAFFRGFWPVAALRLTDARDTQLRESLSALARFGVAWAGRGGLRPCPELLEPMHLNADAPIFAAQDGVGRHFVCFDAAAPSGLTLALPPGFFRHYWISPAASRVVDRGESAEGGPRMGIPGCGDADARLLVIEGDEAPDPLTSW